MAKNRKSRSLFRGFNPKFKQAKRTRKTRSNKPAGLTFENLEPRQLLAVATFQEGLNNYIGAQDTVLFSQARDSNFGGETAISVDQQDANGVRQGLLQFSDLFGDSSIGFTQIPEGSTINSATLSFEITNPSTSQAQISMYRMLVTWDEGSATWNTFGDIGGVQASEGEATALPADYTLFDPRRTSVLGADAPVSDPDRVPGDPGTFDVTRSLQSWSAGETVNNGWLIESTATDGWDLSTSEDAQGSRPFLRVDFTPPSANQDTISFLDSRVTKNEGGDGTQTLSLTVARLGGNSGTDTVTFAVADGTATDTGPSDDYDVATAGNTLTFMPGEITKTIDITINDDTVLEGNETLTVTLSNPVGASLGSNFQTTVTIADNDALINEVLANVSDVDNIGVDETDREYVELIGTPGASLDDYYFVVFEGQEEEAGGGGGVADLVVNLAGQTFGANGLLVLRPTNWLYTKAADSNELVVPSLGTLNGLEDDSQTYALVRTTGLAPVQGTDYDTIGAYVGTSQDAVDSPLGEVGLLDVAPFTVGGDAQIVDSVSVFNGGSDRDRAIVTGDLGLPGVHVHQPTRTLNGADNVASDAVSRLNGNTQPNTIGSWFNGDILSTEADDLDSVGGDNDVIEYQNGSTKISAVAPDGSVLTPGALNVLNNVFIEADVVSIDEPGGGTVNVTFTVTRTGDLSSPLSVSYNTVDGSAKAGSDFVGQPSGTVNFTADALASVQTKTITVVVNTDTIAEGFEDFGVEVTEAASPFLITQDFASVRINDGDVLVADFQQGVVGTQGGAAYNGTQDTYIDAEPNRLNTFFGSDQRIRVDDAEGGDFTGGGEGVDIRPQQGLIQFDNMFGSGTNQVDAGSQIFGATLTLNVTGQSNNSANINFFRMLKPWNEVATWNDPQGSVGSDISNGIRPDDIDASAIIDFSVPMPEIGGPVEIPLNVETLQGWANGTLDNYGWVAISDSGELWEFDSSETIFANRPKLTLQYTEPTGQGSFTFAQQESGASQGEARIGEGGTAEIVVNRVGGSSGAAAVDFQISFGTATSGDIGTVTPVSGTLNFANGELSQTISIPTIDDSDLEANERLTITLTPNNGSILSQADELDLIIRDNDASVTNPPALVSEIAYNQPGNDGGSEMFELVGTPGAKLGSFYAAVIAGDSGADQGATDLIVDLGEFEIGPNGTLLIGAEPGSFNWNIPAGTTYVGLPELNAEFLGGNDNGTSTYALIYSPTTSLHVGRYDYDVDNNGGSLDLPPDAVIVDSIAVRDTDATVFNDDTTYTGGGSNTFFQPFGTGDALDGLTRSGGNTARNSAAAWYAGDYIGSDDALVYDFLTNSSGFAESINLPNDGAAGSPGLPNASSNPIVAFSSVDAAGGTVTVSFSDAVDQILVGDGTTFTGGQSDALVGPGLSVTDTSGTAVAGIDAVPANITGYGTNTLTLEFSGANTLAGGGLPAGTYNLNIVFAGTVAGGRAVDGAGIGAPSNASIEFTVEAVGNDTDFNDDNSTDGFDFLAWQRGFGTPAATNADGDTNADGAVDGTDLDNWQTDYGTTTATVAAAQQPAFEESETSTASFGGNVWLTASSGLESEVEAAPLAEESAEGTIDSAFSSRELLWVSASAEEYVLVGSEDASEEEDTDSLDEAFAELATV